MSNISEVYLTTLVLFTFQKILNVRKYSSWCIAYIKNLINLELTEWLSLSDIEWRIFTLDICFSQKYSQSVYIF